ncbi:MAG: carboxypeptidase regulatory-like domain-containing protein [Candidatus Eisenbacteria bacterium]
MPRAAFRWCSPLLLVLSLLAGSALPARAAATRVTGQVLDSETLQPVAGAEIELQNSGGGPGYFRVKADAKGEFAIERVATSRYYLFTVGAEGYSDWALEGWQFPAAQRDVRIVVPLERAGELRVKVTAVSGGKPLAGARVNVRSERARSWWENASRDPEPRWTNAAGEVAFTGLATGYWTVAVEATGLRSDEVQRVQVRRGEATPIALALSRPASLAGTVRLADSTGVAGVSVVARGPGEATATTDGGGFWSLGELAPGRWRVDVQHDGLQPVSGRDALVLREGESRELPAFKVTPQPAAFSFVLQREVFPPEEKPRVGLRAFRVGEIEMTVWRLPVARLLDAKQDFRTAYVRGADTTGLERVERWTHRVDDGPPFAWREGDMALPHELPAGVYVLQGKAGALFKRTLFFVSDLGLVVKRSPERTVVWAGSLKTGLPLGDVAVFTVGAGGSGNELGDGRDWSAVLAAARARRTATDADGLANLATNGAGNRVRVVALSEKHGVSVAESPLSGEAEQGGDQLYLFTERPIYRPGQPVHWKLFARDAAPGGAGWNVPAPGDVTLTLSGPDGATLDVPGAKLSAGGAADGTLELPADVALGDWTLSARAGRASGAATLAVQHYRKPEYKVEVTPDRAVYVNGDEVRFRVAANYFFGASVVGAQVRWTLFESRLDAEDAEASEWADDGSEGGESGYGRLLESGETRTDVDGRVSVAFTPQRVAYDRRLSLEVEVVDGAQRAVSARGAAIVGRGLFRIELRPLRGVFRAGQPLQVDVLTRDHEGKPVSAAVTVELDQDVWNPLERRYTRSSRPLASLQSQTSVARGFGRVTLSPAVARAGWLKLRARADDARGNRIGAETSLWVYDEKVWSYGYRYPSLEAIADRDTFAPGDTASILVNTDVKDASVLVSVEGRTLRDVRVQHLFGGTGLVRVPLTAADAPNTFVAIHVRRGREVHSRVLELAVRGERHDLAIALTPDRQEYRPRDEAKWTVETRDGAGRPVAAEVAVGVVDEAIYSLRADQTPDPHGVFYGRRPNWVTTVVSFPTLYYAGADKGDAGDVRRDFRDVALWAPVVRTGADGRAEVTLRWPDNLTTWRATARGMTANTLVGTSVARTRVSKELVARLAVPRNFVAGDEATLTSVVTNRTAAALTGVSEALTVSGFAKLTGAPGVTSALPPNGESRNGWAVTAAAESPRDGSDAVATFVFRARGRTDSDALEQPVPVRPRAVPLALGGAGVVRDGETRSETITLPADLVRSGSTLTVDLAPSPGALALSGVEHALGYPYGCTEQTASAITPALALLAAARTANVTVPGWDDPDKRLTPYVQRLASLQSDLGGWSWWKEGETDPYMTAMAIGALARAANAGVQRDVALGAIRNAQWAVPRLMGDVRSVDGEAFCAMHLSTVGALGDDAQDLNELASLPGLLAQSAFDQRERLGTGGLACEAIALARLGRGADASTVLALLAKRGQTGPTGLTFPADAEGAWWGDPLANTALALEAFATVAPADPRCLQLVQALAARRDGRGWRNTSVTGQAATAIARWLEGMTSYFGGAGETKLTWNGEPLTSGMLGAGSLSGAPMFGKGVTLTVPAAKLNPGANTLVVSRGAGAWLFWSWSARANVPSPGPAAAPGAKLAVKREYLRAERTADRRGRPRWLTTPLDPKQPIKVGEGILVRLTLTATAPLERLLVEDPRPAGFEIDQVLPPGAERPWALSAEARDDKAAFFVTSVEAGDTVIEYLLRPEIPGLWTALPAFVGGMYDPGISARSAEARLRIMP